MIPCSIAVKTLQLRIDVEKSAYHQLSQNEIDCDNPFDDASEPSSLHSATEPSRS